VAEALEGRIVNLPSSAILGMDRVAASGEAALR
jgi:hypothetical protein